MDFNDFERVYDAAAEANFRGENLLVSGAGKDLVIKPVMLHSEKTLEVYDLGESASLAPPRVYTKDNYFREDYTGMRLNPAIEALLNKGEKKYGTKSL